MADIGVPLPAPGPTVIVVEVKGAPVVVSAQVAASPVPGVTVVVKKN